MTAPTPQARYASSFDGATPQETERASKALAFALDVRKLEIELYWTRAAYFWAFTGAAFGAYITVLGAEKIANRPQALLLVCCLGLVFSVAWYFVNRASKYWQLNWELHVDLLEDQIMGPIYKTTLHDRPSFMTLHAAYPFSVSKINQLLSLFVVFVFAVLLAETLRMHYQITRNWEFFPTACIVVTFAAILAFWKFGRVGGFTTAVVAKVRKTEVTEFE